MLSQQQLITTAQLLEQNVTRQTCFQ